MDIDLEELACVIDLLKSAEFSEFRYEKGEVRLIVRRGTIGAAEPLAERMPQLPAVAATPPLVREAQSTARAVAAVPSADLPANVLQVKAPLLGTFYSRPKPGEAPFVQVGDRVTPDTVLCIVEVMKLMNSVTADCAGVVAAVHAADGALVEFGMPLFSIVPDAS